MSLAFVSASIAGLVLTTTRKNPKETFDPALEGLKPRVLGKRFGASLSLGSTTSLVVGAPLIGSNASEMSGRAYKYTWNFETSNWEFQTHYVPSSPTENSDWGFAVAMGSDDICLVGSPSEGSYIVHVLN